jgi:hypothetical protein
MQKSDSADRAQESKSCLDRTKGVEALSLPVKTPNNSEETLHFQWMRLHPLTLIALSDGGDRVAAAASETALHVSQTFHRYRRAAANNKAQQQAVPRASVGTGSSTPVVESESFLSPFFQASGLGVDLSDLIEPPLISTSVPRFSDEEETDDSVKRQCLERAREFEKVNVRVQEALAAVVVSAFTEIERSYAIETPELHLDSLSSLTTLELRTSLSSGFLYSFLKNKYAERCGQIKVMVGTCSEFFLLSLVLLAQFGANERLGRHMLQVIAPSILADCNDLVTDASLAHVGTRLFQRLAKALVLNCSLGLFSKSELLDLMPELEETNSALDSLRELFCCLGEVYTATKKT